MGDKLRDLGLLVLRVGMGVMFMGHGWPKLAGGSGAWAKIGGHLAKLGIDFAPVFFGFMAAVAEFFGGLLIAVGLAFRPSLAMLIATMVVAASSHLRAGDGFVQWSHSVEAGIVFVAMFLIGPGRFTLASRLGGGR